MRRLDLDENKIIELYKTKSGLEIAKIFGVDQHAIYSRLRKNGIKTRNLREARLFGGVKYKNLDVNKIINLYKSGKSRLELSRIFKVSEGVIRNRLIKNNVSLRNIKEAFVYIDQSREKSNKWNGGKIKNGDGYILIYKPEHPRAVSGNYVYEHHLIWEEANGKLLPSNWVIHHINGIKDDNRIENLAAMSKSEHSKILRVIKKRIISLEKENKRLKEELKEYKKGDDFLWV